MNKKIDRVGKYVLAEFVFLALMLASLVWLPSIYAMCSMPFWYCVGRRYEITYNEKKFRENK